MLTVDDNEFWEGVSPVEFGKLPSLQDAVTVVGYPIGGDTISVTSGVVSRIEILSYVHGSTELLGLQVDYKPGIFSFLVYTYLIYTQHTHVCIYTLHSFVEFFLTTLMSFFVAVLAGGIFCR